jgi:DNA-binding transcriptional LysR family regulator
VSDVNERQPWDRTAAARGLRVGFVPGVTVTKWTRIWADRHPRTRLELVDVVEEEQRAALDDAGVDMCFVRLPVDGSRLHVIPLYEEVPVVVVPKDHPVSLFDEVSLADLSEETVLDDVDPEQAVDLVAGGAGVLLVPQSIARSHSRRDLVYRPVSDAAPTRIALAWLVENPNELIEEFIGIVRGRTPNSSRSSAPSSTPQPAKGTGGKGGKGPGVANDPGAKVRGAGSGRAPRPRGGGGQRPGPKRGR